MSDIPQGARIGMSFNQGELSHEDYGSAGIVSGVIPLLIPHGSYKKPSIMEDPERMSRLVAKMSREYASLWEDDLDSEVASKVRDFMLFGAHTHPEEPETERMQTYISVIILIFAIDDLCDQLSDNSSKAMKYTDIKKMTQFLVDIFEGAYASLEEMPNPIKAIEASNAFIWKAKCLCEENIPRWDEVNKYVKQEWVNVLSSYVLFTEKGDSAENKGARGFSETSRVLFGAYQAAVTGYVELVALLMGLTIKDEIRENILFRRMREAAGSVSNLMNDMFGLERDMKLGQVNDTSILRKVIEDGVPLAEAWKDTLKCLCSEINDVRLCAKYLREMYGEDEDLMVYLGIVERHLDGQAYWYAHTERYRESNLKVVQIE